MIYFKGRDGNLRLRLVGKPQSLILYHQTRKSQLNNVEGALWGGAGKERVMDMPSLSPRVRLKCQVTSTPNTHRPEEHSQGVRWSKATALGLQRAQPRHLC